MNSPHDWSEAQIHAHVDGELDAALDSQIVADCMVDAALAARVARQRRLRSLLAASFDPVLREPVPERLQAALRGAVDQAAVPIGAARPARTPRPAWSLREWSAIAASLVLGVLAGVVALRPMGTSQFQDSDRGTFARGQLEAALNGQITGEARAESGTAIIVSFVDAGGRICRAFSQNAGNSGLACRQADGWRMETFSSVSSLPAAQPEYRQAASALPPAIIVAMEGLRSGEALTPEQERRLREGNWQGAVIAP